MKKAKLKDFKKSPEEFRKIVFFSEGKSYWNTFSGTIDYLIKQKQPCSYITMESDDPGLDVESDLIQPYYIGNGLNLMLFMNMLEADVVVMTTPGLGSLNIKRSPGVKHYIHIVHSPTDMTYYRKYSFDHFDTIMCSGKHQIKTLRKLEKIRGTKEKDLLETGCAYMDILANKLKNGVKPNETADSKTILFAPTWGNNGALSLLGSSIIKPLAEAGFHIIIRPHPQQFRSEMSLITQIKKELKKYGNIEWDDNPSGHNSLLKADIMISDMSGVIFDFAFIYLKPVISLDFKVDVNGKEAEDLGHEAWELDIRSKLGLLYNPSDSITDLVSSLSSVEYSRESLLQLRNQSVFNWNNTGPVAGKQILEILNRLQEIN